MGKDNFILYSSHKELFETLTDAQAGKLIKSIFQYEDNGEIPKLSSTTQMAFIAIKSTLDRSKEKYEKVVARNRENGKKGGRPKNPNNPSGFLETQDNLQKPKKADNDNDNDSDNDSDNDKDIVVDNKLAKIIKYYESNIGLVLPATAPDLIEISNKFNEELVFKAIDIACKRNIRNLSYVEGILRDWEKKGYKILADIQEEQKKKDKFEVESIHGDFEELYEN